MSNSYFKNIDTIEKAYILGLVNKNNNFISALAHNKYILNILSQLSPDIEKLYIINIIDKDIINDIKNATKLFDTFNDNLKIAFSRGLYESNYYDKIEITNNIKSILDSIIDYIFYDIKFNIIKTNDTELIIIKNKFYKNKFINKIYTNDDLTLLTTFAKNIMLFDSNNRPNIKVIKTDSSAIIPSKAYPEDAGYDLTIIKKIKDLNSKTALYDTCIKIEIDEGYYTEIIPRSSISKFGYILANNTGIIDNNYRGNLMIALTKIADDAPNITLPFKCCQLIVREQILSNLYEVNEENLSTTLRNDGGFGSTSNRD